MATDKPVRLTADQLDRLILLHRRKLQLAEKRLLHLGVSPAVIDRAVTGADEGTTPLADGGTIEFDSSEHHLVDHDETSVTLRRV